MGLGANYLWLALVTFGLSLVLTRAMRRTLGRFRSQEHKTGKEFIYRHFPKMKKPLGGGVAIFAALTGGLVLAQVTPLFGLAGQVSAAVWIWLLCGLLFGGIGLIDDWRKVNAARGLDERAKLLLQIAAGLLITLLIVNVRHEQAIEAVSVYLPFVGWIPLTHYLFLPFGVLVIVGASNAVNLTDGLDGLAGSALALSFICYLALDGLLQHPGVPTLVPLLALAATAGFLMLNRPPARIIMGDTGALGLGAALGALALLSRTEWLLLLIGAPFVIDTVSVLIQVSVIKFFRGPVVLLRHRTTEIFRPFLCTPLHHHFQWLAWGPWPILALFTGTGLLSGLLALMATPAALGPSAMAYGWFWLLGVGLQVAFLIYAAGQKAVRANYFLGLEEVEGHERVLALYKGLPMSVFGRRWHQLEEITEISESMITTIAAESILWRNISEIEARATLGKIYAEYRQFDRAAAEWEEIPQRNLLIRESLVVQLGKIYFGREELLRAIKLWEQLPPARLGQIPGLAETIQSAKVRVGHLAGRLYHQAKDHTLAMQRRLEGGDPPRSVEVAELISELEGGLRYTQDLRDLLAYEQHKAESAMAVTAPDEGTELYGRMEALLTTRREELLQALRWAQALASPDQTAQEEPALCSLAAVLGMTTTEVVDALAASNTLQVEEFARIDKPSRNTLYRVGLGKRDGHLPARLVAKCFQDTQVTFFSACYRRERGVMELLLEAGAPVPRLYGGYLGPRQGVLFLEDVGTQDLASALREIPAEQREARMTLLRRGVETLVMLRVHAQPMLARLDREIARIVKEVLTPEYYVNTTAIALGRILALDRRNLSTAERGRLEIALRPVIAPLLEAQKTFIHFEYTPGNLLVTDGRVVALDFEQSTMGPAAFDLATLLYSPDADLTPAEVRDLVDYYHDLLPAAMPTSLTVQRSVLEAAAVIKLLFYAGSAANFYRKYDEPGRVTAMEWYLRQADRLMAARPDFQELALVLRSCWSGQTHLPV